MPDGKKTDEKKTGGKNREGSFEPVRRILFLHNLLRKASPGRKLTARRATDQMNSSGMDVGLRTVQRYLELCEEHFAGVRRDDSKPAGWWWEENTIDDALHLSKETSLALCLAEAHLKHLIPSAELKHLAPLFQHARKTIEFGGSVSRYKKMLERICIFPRGLQLIPPGMDSRIFDQLMNAILESNEIEIMYRKPNEKTHRLRKIRPLGIVDRSGVYYIVGSDCEKLNDNPQNWAMHRIAAVNEKSRFAYPKNFRIVEHAKAGNLHISYAAEPLKIHLRLGQSASYLLESKLSDDQKTSQLPDGRIDLVAHVPDTIELRWFLLSMAHDCTVLEPQTLRREVHQMLIKGIENFGPDSSRRAG